MEITADIHVRLWVPLVWEFMGLCRVDGAALEIDELRVSGVFTKTVPSMKRRSKNTTMCFSAHPG